MISTYNPKKEPDDWADHKNNVLSSLERIENGYKDLNKTVSNNYINLIQATERIHGEINGLKTEVHFRAGLWGLLAGGLPVIFGLAIYFLNHVLIK